MLLRFFFLAPTMISDAERRLAVAAEAWLPAQDRDARTLILAFLREVEDAGADPVAELRDGMRRWFGARAASALPAPRREEPQADGDTIALEPLSPARHPTMWPQRPKRLTDEIFSSWLWRTAVVGRSGHEEEEEEGIGF